MKKLFFILLILSFTGELAAQKRIGLVYSPLSSAMAARQRMNCGGISKSLGGNMIGLRYEAGLSKRFSFQTGFDFSRHNFEHNPSMGGTDFSPRGYFVQQLSVPLWAKMKILKYFFLNGGIALDVETGSEEKQSGFGYGLGIGVEIPVKKWTFSVNPLVNRYAVMSFERNSHSVISGGVRFGVFYQIAE